MRDAPTWVTSLPHGALRQQLLYRWTRTVERTCCYCGVKWSGLLRFGPRSVCLNEQCEREHKKALKRKERQAYGNTHRRRAKRFGCDFEPVNPLYVFERDRWRCKLCGVSTPRSLRGSIDDRAPELDHIVPLSIGGAHTAANLQCACRSCNGKKGATALGQLNLAI